MEKKKRPLKIIVSMILVIAIIHSASHFIFFGTGLAGFAITENNNNAIRSISPMSIIAITLEWSFLIIFAIVMLAKNRTERKKEIESLNLDMHKYKKTGKTTELDILYNVLKDKKHLRLSTISKIFNVKREIALDWIKSLESQNLVEIEYPRIGELEIKIIET